MSAFLAVGCNAYDPSLRELGLGGASAGGAGAAGLSSGGGDPAEGGSPVGFGGSGGGVADGGDPELGGESGGGVAGRATGGDAGTGGTLAGAAGKSSMGGGGTSSGGGGGFGGSNAGNGGNGGGAMGGNTGSAGTGGDGGALGSASGCVKLTVPLNETTDKAHFVIALGTPVDMSAATISMRLYVQAGSGGTVFNYVQDSGTYHFFSTPSAKRYAIGSLKGWSSFAWDIGAEPVGSSNIVKTSIKNIGIEVNAAPSTSWSDPTIIYIDSMFLKSPALSYAFSTSSSISSTVDAPGQALWLNPGPTDTTAKGATLTWQATCP